MSRIAVGVWVLVNVVVSGYGQSALAQCQLAKLVAGDAVPGTRFGSSVAIDGDRVVVGAVQDGSTGAAYVFERDAEGWSQRARLVASDAAPGDFFGVSTAISGDYIVIGATLDDDAGNKSGSCYVFRHNGTSWVEDAKLTAADAASLDWFGTSVSISGDYIVVGADGDDDNATHNGAAHVFRRDVDGWVEQVQLVASDDARSFGSSVAINGDYILVGAPYTEGIGFYDGAAYVFHRQGETWTEQAKLTSGEQTHVFGRSVALLGDRAVVGAYYAEPWAYGAAFVFEREGTNWLKRAKLSPTDPVIEDLAVTSVAMDGDYIVVGAWSTEIGNPCCYTGAGYVYRLGAGTWTQEAVLTPPTFLLGDYFAYSVALSGAHVVLGASRDDESGEDAGAAYAFQILGGPDCNTNTINDACELDCDGDGIPEACEPSYVDCNENGEPDDCDVFFGYSDDCNTNGVPDECDISDITSNDCNLNGVPDECEPNGDCNNNGTEDLCDIGSATSQDCNKNSIPDECDTTSQTSDDCNNNLVPDECEPDRDCNYNGLTDICDIANGLLEDTDGNWIADICDCDSPTFTFVPVHATGPHTIENNEIVLPSGGQSVFLEVRMCGWDSDLDRTPALSGARAKQDTSGFSNGLSPSDLTYALEPCTRDAECETVFGAGSNCDFPSPVGFSCNPAYMDMARPDWPRAAYTIPVAGAASVDFGFVLALPECGGCYLFDDGSVKYIGTLVLDIPPDAVGSFTVGFLGEPDTVMKGASEQLTLLPATITIHAPPIPTLSQWGLAIMALLTTALGSIIVARRARAPDTSSRAFRPV